MIKRIIDISEPAYLHLRNQQLLIEKNEVVVGSIPVEDLGAVILENSQIVITQALIVACQRYNVIIVFCDERHLPYSITLPISDGHSLHNKILRQQVEWNKTSKKRLWKQIVIHKIQQQSKTLERAGKNAIPLNKLSQKVRSGDPENIEAQAAKKYWTILFGSEFRRITDEPGINVFLNYGYAIVRAMVARAIVGSGLHPSLGVFHKNQYNGLCLADDLMEPFRPWVDWIVFDWVNRTDGLDTAINQETKSMFLRLPSESVIYDNKKMPLMNACHYMLADFKKAFIERSAKIKYPDWPSQMMLL